MKIEYLFHFFCLTLCQSFHAEALRVCTERVLTKTVLDVQLFYVAEISKQ